VTDVGAVLGRFEGELFQSAWVVDDLDAAKAAMGTALGCGAFVAFEMDPEWDVRGRTVNSPLACAFARSGNLQIELMQPLGTEGVVAEFLARFGPGPHHLGIRVDGLEAAVEAAGVPVAMSADFGSLRLAFLDTVDDLGLYLELLEDPEGMLWATAPWRDGPRLR